MSLLASGCVSGACHSILRAFGLPVGPEGWATVTDKDWGVFASILDSVLGHPRLPGTRATKRCGCGAETGMGFDLHDLN